MFMNLPNFLTMLRILFVPLLVITFYLSVPWNYKASSFLFALAAITDWFDGFLARRLNQITRFGAFFDPVADKIIVVTSVCLLIEAIHSLSITLPVLIIMSRELTVSALREWNAKIGSSTDISVSLLGKIKTLIQMTSITVLLYSCTPGEENIRIIGIVLLDISVFFTVLSLFSYMKSSWSEFHVK